MPSLREADRGRLPLDHVSTDSMHGHPAVVPVDLRHEPTHIPLRIVAQRVQRPR